MNYYANVKMTWCDLSAIIPLCLSISLALSSLRLKGELAYNYKGPRTKDDIVEFTNRVSG